MDFTKVLNERSKRFHLTVALLLVVAIALVSLFSGPDVSLLIFYIAPVFLAAWFVGRSAGLLVSVASGLSWLLVARLAFDHYSHPLIPYWNALAGLGFMLILAQVMSAFRKSHLHERQLARTDYLTGAVNKRYFVELAQMEINRGQRHGHPFTLAYIDVDDFKLINDRHGHSAGDRLLSCVADTIRANVRGLDVVARLGGDEFAILMPETNGVAARSVIRRMRLRLLEVARLNGWAVTFSIGLVTWDAPPSGVDEMLKAADGMMYAAKNAGKNRITHSIESSPATAA